MTDIARANFAASPRLSRRAFGALSLLAAIRPTFSFAEPPAGKFVDVHTHIGRVWALNKELTVDGLLSWMDEHEVAQAVVLPLVSPESSSYPIASEYVLTHTAGHRDRLIPFCSIDPRTSYGGKQGIKAMLARYLDAGVKGFGEHKPGIAINHPLNMALYEAISEAKLPILFHVDNERNMDAPGLPGLEAVLKAFPRTVFIGHAPGWWASISGDATQADLGGYPKTKVIAGGAIDRLMEAYPNLYGDLSAGSGANALSRDLDFARQFLVRRSDRILFGTDYLQPGQPVPQFELFNKTLDLPEAVRSSIYRDNARRILKIV